MSEVAELSRRLARAERYVSWLSAGLLVCLLAVMLGMARTSGWEARALSSARGGDVITARGLVIVDHAGRERVVIGAPLDEASDDERLAGAVGMVVLDSAGRLSVSVGLDNPLVHADGTAGERLGSGTGLTFYDPRTGQERGGIGAFEDGRANMCLDYRGADKEAACVSVAPDDQYAAFILNGTPGEDVFDRVVMFVGADGTGRIKAFGGLENRDGVSIDVGRGMPAVTIYDADQAAVFDLVETGRR